MIRVLRIGFKIITLGLLVNVLMTGDLDGEVRQMFVACFTLAAAYGCDNL